MSLNNQTAQDARSLYLGQSEVYELPDEYASNGNTATSKLQDELVRFGLTPNEAKVYIYLAKYGHRRAVEIAKSVHTPRTETYRLLSSLQNKGLVAATFEHPIKFSAVPFDKALKMLINIEKERLRTFERKEKDLLSLWDSIPDLVSTDSTDGAEEKFQILEGQVQVYSRAKDMRAKAQHEVLVLGYEKDYMKLYHYDFMDGLDELAETGTVKLLATFSANSLDFFRGIDPKVIRQIPSSMNAPLCFIMRDRCELLFFIKNNGMSNKGVSAMWTDCKPYIEAMYMLFSELWKNSVRFEVASKKLQAEVV